MRVEWDHANDPDLSGTSTAHCWSHGHFDLLNAWPTHIFGLNNVENQVFLSSNFNIFNGRKKRPRVLFRLQVAANAVHSLFIQNRPYAFLWRWNRSLFQDHLGSRTKPSSVAVVPRRNLSVHKSHTIFCQIYMNLPISCDLCSVDTRCYKRDPYYYV